MNFFDESSSEWFKYYETYFLLSICQKGYNGSRDIVDRVFSNKYFDKLSFEDGEKWKLFNAYLRLVYLGNFDSKKFDKLNVLEAVPKYDRDKEGFNAALIILQFLYFIEQRQLTELVKRRDELKGYMANHFKENFSYRSRTMYKLLNIVVENNFDLKKIQIKSRYLVRKLNENHVVGNAYTELEVVPYEQLWDLVLNMLKYHDTRGF